MKKLPLIAGIIFLAMGGFLIWQHANQTATSASVSHGVEFVPKNVVVGEQYGTFKVVSAKYSAPSESYPIEQYTIAFAGTMTLVGTYGKGGESGCFTPLRDVSASIMQQLPRNKINSNIPSVLDLSLDDVGTNQFSVGDTVEVTIDRFVAAYVGKECGNDYGHVVSIRKI